MASLIGVDANGDGVIDASDPVFDQLQIWRDANSDGVLTNGETVRITDLGLSSLDYRMGTFVQNGQTRHMGTLTLDALNNPNALFIFNINSTLTTGETVNGLIQTPLVKANACLVAEHNKMPLVH